ncbi:MAG: DEAD/DEAH box helicase [Pseudomonadota bacterium]
MSTQQMNQDKPVRAIAMQKTGIPSDIRDFVSSEVYKRGAAYYRDGRVISFELDDDDTIHAEVEGSEIYEVDISWDDGEPIVDCACPYDWEPVCKHAVAAILYWQGDGESERKIDKIDTEEPPEFHFNRDRHISELAELERKKRRSKKLLESLRILKKPKGSLHGEYLVASGTANGSYSVMVRDARDLNRTTCDCPDYLINELGTCKHIELVKGHVGGKKNKGSDSRIWISLQPKDTYAGGGPPFGEIHIHAGDEGIRGRLFARTAPDADFWNPDGYLRDATAGTAAGERFSGAIEFIKRCFGRKTAPEIVIANHVPKLLREIDADRSWKTRMEKIASAPRQSAEWMELKNSLPIKLYDYQEEGILFAASRRKSFIGDDMGLGKTVQAIVAALLIKKLAGISKVLIFCPASLKFQWKREIEKISGEKVQIVQGNRFIRQKLYEGTDAMFLIVNYELIFRDEDLLHELKPDMIILDEAQRIKNWETKTAKGMKRLKSEFSLILTGTPFENRLTELHSLCEFLHPRPLGPMWRLLPTYGNLDVNDKLTGFSNLSQLRSRIAPFFIRREKEAVLGQLPGKIVNEYTTEITDAQRKHHDDYEAALAAILGKAKKRPLTPEEMKRAFMCLSAMRIISNALAQHDWKKFQPIVDEPGALTLAQIRSFHSPKLLEFRSVMEELLENPREKFVIFSQWERMLLLAEASIRDLLMKDGMESVIFSGSIQTAARGKVIDRFINDPKLRIFFSTDAGGLGLNLQESASCVINLEMPWNPAVLEQRIARVHRLGQRNTVNVINFISTGCIEERVYQAVGNKKLLFDGVFDGKTDSVAFEKGSAFIERLKGIICDADDCKAAGEVKPEVIEDLQMASEDKTPSPAEVSLPAAQREIDLTGFVKILGSLVGDKKSAHIEPQSFKVGIEERDGEVSLKLKKPPKELISGARRFLSGLLAALDGMEAG